jgi:arylsulfatase A-like enzyme
MVASRHRLRKIGVVAIVTATLLTVDLTDADPAADRSPTRTTGESSADPVRPNIVVLLTDDQRRDTLRYMPIVRRSLAHHGITFTDGYVVNPLCCPSRTSVLTGLYSHSTGVYTNHRPDGGFYAFKDDSTVATWLHAAGYRTGLFGKYLNQYGRDPYVPPGWDRWFATYDNGGFYDYEAISDGAVREYGSDSSSYGTTVLRDEAVTFIEETDPATPIFVYWAPHAPHEPATPQRSDRGSFTSLPPWRPTSYDEADVEDKPGYVSRRPRIDPVVAEDIDRFRERQIESLQAVDRAVRAIVRALRDTGRLHDTMIVFLSDNGMLWGEHRMHGKDVPYEEAIGVPFVVRYDALITQPHRDDHLVLNIDLAPTFAALAGTEAPDMEGRSLVPLLRGGGATWRDAFLVEHVGSGLSAAPTFCALHTDRHVLIRYATGEEELYDLVRDPHQIANQDGNTTFALLQRDLRTRLRRRCDPAPPGLSL